jgi:hypothetical protein
MKLLENGYLCAMQRPARRTTVPSALRASAHRFVTAAFSFISAPDTRSEGAAKRLIFEG